MTPGASQTLDHKLNIWKRFPHEESDKDAVVSTARAQGPFPLLLFIACIGAVVGVHVPSLLYRTLGVSNWGTRGALSALVVGLAAALLLSMPGRADPTRDRSSSVRIGRYPLLILFAGAVVFAVWIVIRDVSVWWILIPIVLAAFNALAYLVPYRPKELVNDEALNDRVRRFCREADIEVTTVAVEDEPGAGKLDALVVGRGKRGHAVIVARRMLERPRDQLEVLLAHEVGHLHRHHAPLIMLGWFGALFFAFSGVRVILASPQALDWLGAASVRDPKALPALVVFGVVLGVPAFLTLAWLRRGLERRADLDALEFTRDAEALAAYVATTIARTPSSRWARAWSDFPTPAERLAFASWWSTTNVVAVLFTDIEGSTGLVERLGDRRWFELLQDHNTLMRAAVITYGGQELENPGDGFLFMFADAGQAVLCAQQLQRSLVEFNATAAHEPVRVRMGVHTGEVIRHAGGVSGREVHLAARIASKARGGQILVSTQVKELLDDTSRFSFEDRGELTLKGLAGRHRVFAADWSEEVPA